MKKTKPNYQKALKTLASGDNMDKKEIYNSIWEHLREIQELQKQLGEPIAKIVLCEISGSETEYVLQNNRFYIVDCDGDVYGDFGSQEKAKNALPAILENLKNDGMTQEDIEMLEIEIINGN